MNAEKSQPVLLKDYRPADYNIVEVHLDFVLDDTATTVVATLQMAPNPEGEEGAPLLLDGDDLSLVSAYLDGVILDPAVATPDSFVLKSPPKEPFQLKITTTINPLGNTKLMGLFRSGSAFCTQCEAEGFRRITYFLDRPDVMSVYTTRIEADKTSVPILLGNGNLEMQGDLPNGRHFAVWHDPHRKPCYLFALVGGSLGSIHDHFTTCSGRNVDLGIYVEPGNESRALYAMGALKRSMQWDETTFGREYDLDVFNIVAVSDFNMGAMENKGLNIFNDKYVLAQPGTATDVDYAHIEAVIAHEYFHNWTGNRITCRDWFQLCLKEGLTVFRDQEFSSDERSRAVKRIQDVKNLRSVQFVEDAGPLAHNVRPESYMEINNFYTSTIYEKGAEVVRMLKTLIGDAAFRSGMDNYFARYDGSAATIENFIACFAEVTGRNLDQFMLWYSQAGTPQVTVTTKFDQVLKTFSLTLTQKTEPTPKQVSKLPFVIPVRLGFVGYNGPMNVETSSDLSSLPLIEFTKQSQMIVYKGITERPVVSLFRGFSAPVKVIYDQSDVDLMLLAQNDTDPFNRWQSCQNLALRALIKSVLEGSPCENVPLADSFDLLLKDAESDPAFAALMLALPTEADIAREIAHNVDPSAVRVARESLRFFIASHIHMNALALHRRLKSTAIFSPDARSAGKRALKAVLLDYLVAYGSAEGLQAARTQFEDADNMSDKMAAMSALSTRAGDDREQAFETFYQTYKSEHLVMDKWFSAQAVISEAATLERVKQLTKHPAFSFSNPNRVRSLIGAFAMNNPTQFNRADGEGYRFLTDTVLQLDAKNPQVASRLLTSFRSWRSFEPKRQTQARLALETLAAQPALSADVRDIVSRSLV